MRQQSVRRRKGREVAATEEAHMGPVALAHLLIGGGSWLAAAGVARMANDRHLAAATAFYHFPPSGEKLRRPVGELDTRGEMS